jgi:hypothetical protein
MHVHSNYFIREKKNENVGFAEKKNEWHLDVCEG